MTYIHRNKVNKLAECNLLHDIINPGKRTETLISYYFPIIHGFMNTQKGKANFKNIRILFNSGCSSTIVLGGLINKLTVIRDDLMQCPMQACKITTNLKG